jgi:hypothetical protein
MITGWFPHLSPVLQALLDGMMGFAAVIMPAVSF